MSYAESQKKFCRFVAGHYVVMMWAWKNGEHRFGHRWVINNARYIGRKLLVIKVFKDAIQVRAMNGREPFFVPWFVLEEFQNFQPIPTRPVATNNEPKKDVVESIAEGMVLKDANYKGREEMLSNPAVVATKNLQSGEVVYAMDIAVAGSDVMKSKPLFAGFWRDGAVVTPEKRHVDIHGRMTFKRKSDGETITKLTEVDDLVCCDKFYWLDTTTPTELTPQEAFELLRVVYPQLHRIRDDGDGFAMMEGSPLNACIKWNGETQYPPRERWRVPTDEDKGSKCRAWSTEKREWVDAIFISTWQDAFVAKVSYWPFPVEFPKCEVLVDESN